MLAAGPSSLNSSSLAAITVLAADYPHYWLGHPVGVSDYVGLVWLTSSMGIVAGALGSSPET